MKSVTLPNGMTVVDSSRYGAELVYREIFEDRCYCRHGVEVKDGDVVVDVGANVGLFSLWLGTVLRRATVHAFEPARETYGAARRNLARYDRLGVRLSNVALAETDRTVVLRYRPRMSQGTSGGPLSQEQQRAYVGHVLEAMGRRPWSAVSWLLPPRARRRVAGAVLSWYMRDVPEECRALSWPSLGLGRVDLLKIDIEGGEADVLRGVPAGSWPSIRQVAVEAHSEASAAEVCGILRRHGLDPVVDRGPVSRGRAPVVGRRG